MLTLMPKAYHMRFMGVVWPFSGVMVGGYIGQYILQRDECRSIFTPDLMIRQGV